MLVPLPLRFVAGGEVVEELGVHLHEGLEHVVDEGDYRLVPVLFADAVEGREHDRHYHVVVLLHQRHDVLVVPEVEGALGHLKIEQFSLIHTSSAWV